LTPAELIACRQALGLTQTALVRRLDVSSNTLARWERGEVSIGNPALVRLGLDRLIYPVLLDGATQHTQWPTDPSLQSRRTFPLPPTRLVGRERDQEVLDDLLRRELRFLTLTGPGGVGKTPLAISVAEKLQQSFEHGA